MIPKKYQKFIAASLTAICLIVWHQPAWAISLKEEKQLSQEFMRVINRYYKLIDDPVITAYVNEVGQRLLSQMPPQPFAYKFHVIDEDVYNAFAIPAGYIFVNSGLFLAMDREDELAGILAHEISHVVCRHISQRIERSKKIELATLAGMVAGIFLGVAGGGADASQALTLGSVAAGQSASLAFSREDETQADQFGLTYLYKAGYTADGLLEMLKKIRGKQWFDQTPSYMMTHPAIEERISGIDSWMQSRGKESKKTLPPLCTPEEFHRLQYRLRALYGDRDTTLQYFKSQLDQKPKDAGLAYGLGLTYNRLGNQPEAIEYLQKALAQNALDPMVLSDLGKAYFESGRLSDALRVLNGAVSLRGANTLGWFYLGRTQMELGDFAAAADAFEHTIQQQDDYAQAYYFLGQTQEKLGREPDTHYYLGLYYFLKGDDRNAHHHLVRAQK
ncbi:MAG: M48 family metalloprotease, partial [Desulfobacteraceae bacterium]|nr:M48 family metalloprotease [Desulfobacteraceae bacterium]